LDEFKKLHLPNRVWQHSRCGGYLHEKLCMCVHKAVSYRSPVIETVIQAHIARCKAKVLVALLMLTRSLACCRL
jgi:hypothetical protein